MRKEAALLGLTRTVTVSQKNAVPSLATEVTVRDLTALPGVIRRPVMTRDRNEGRPMLKPPSCGDRYSTLLTALIATHKPVSKQTSKNERDDDTPGSR